MVIYPDIEIQRGRCVNLRRGHMQVSINFIWLLFTIAFYNTLFL